MKTLFGTVLCCFLIATSCTKSSNEIIVSPVPSATLKFTVDGSVYEWGGPSSCPYCIPKLMKYIDHLALRASQPDNLTNDIFLKIETQNLSVDSYTSVTGGTTALVNAAHRLIILGPSVSRQIQAASTETGDFATVTITSLHDGYYVDGTFNARLTIFSNGSLSKLDITNGEFHNVQIFLG